jgi:hypothetical protein
MEEYKTLLVKMCDDAAVKEPELTAKQRAAKDLVLCCHSPALCLCWNVWTPSCVLPNRIMCSSVTT